MYNGIYIKCDYITNQLGRKTRSFRGRWGHRSRFSTAANFGSEKIGGTLSMPQHTRESRIKGSITVSNERKIRILACLLVLSYAVLAFTSVACGRDEFVTPAEMAAKDAWVQRNVFAIDRPVASFIYGGVPSAELLPGWRKAPIVTSDLGEGRTRSVQRWTDPVTGLELRIVSVDYRDFPAVEWTAYLTNRGTKETPIIEAVRGIDAEFGGAPGGTVLRTTRGDNFSARSYEPLRYTLDGETKTFEPVGGRPTNGAWPYFNLDYGNRGVILALGWPGQWQAGFVRHGDAVRVWGGQETTHLRLEPGEEIRTPLVALVFWRQANWIRAQNLWRHWFLAYNIPRPGGHLPPLGTSIVPPGRATSAGGDIAYLDAYLHHGVKPGYLWVDAGWYTMQHSWFAATGVGTWVPDPVRYPHGIRQVSGYAHSKGLKFVLWFEPERVYRGSYLWNHHPEWLLHWPANDPGHRDLRLLNLGNPAARKWLTDYISRFITKQGIDVYREDFNVNPLKAWQANDTPDRQGMTENLYVQGFLAYLDALLRRHPGLMIDTCASGGRRNDLETLRRAVPLLRSDYQAPNLPRLNGRMTTDVFDGNQGHTYGLSLWVPFYGTGDYADDRYSARSHLCPWMGAGTNLDNPVWNMGDPDWAAVRRQFADHAAIAKYFYGDYYPLTPYNLSMKAWMAWEFIRPKRGDGDIQAFRHESSPTVELRVKLHALDPSATYEFTDLDTGRTTRASGEALMTQGLRLGAASPRTALILTFRKLP